MLEIRYVIITAVLYSARRQSEVVVQSSLISGGCKDVEVVPNVTLADLVGVSYYLKYTSIVLKTKIDGMKLDIAPGKGPDNNFTQYYTFMNEQKQVRIIKSWGLLTTNEGVNQIINTNVTENYYILSFEKNEHVLMYICNPRAPIAIDARVLYTTNTKLNMDEALYIDKKNHFVGELQQLPNTNINFLMELTPKFD